MGIGDWCFITGDNRIDQVYFNKKFGKGIFGKIIEINKSYSQFTGRKFPDKVKLRCYTKEGRKHLNTYYKYLKLQK